MFDRGLPAIVYEELTGDEYRPVDGVRHITQIIYYFYHKYFLKTLKIFICGLVNYDVTINQDLAS